MQRSISLILILALLIGIFAYAGYKIDADTDENAVTVSIVVSTTFGDKSFNDSAHAGGEKLEAEGMFVNYVECGGQNYKQCVMDAASVSDIVFCAGWEFWEITDVANENPGVKFVWLDNTVEDPEDYTNLINVLYSQNEASYLAGYIASAMSQTGVIGVVGGNDDDTINDFVAGFTQGAQDCNDGVDVLTEYAGGDYDNPVLGKQLAMGLYEQGADIIFQVAGNTGNGVIQAAKEGGFYAIGVDSDQKDTLPEYEDAIICSVIKRIGETIYRITMDYAREGEFNGGTILQAGLSDGSVGLSYGSKGTTKLVDKDLAEEISELSADIIEGEIEVESTL